MLVATDGGMSLKSLTKVQYGVQVSLKIPKIPEELYLYEHQDGVVSIES